jgi:hypothetical protein
MSGHRIAVLVAAAWSTAITGIALTGAAKAEAAWLKTGPGTGYAAALRLLSPGQPVLDAAKCNSSQGGPTATLHWTYPEALPPGFEVLTSASQNGTTTTAGTTTTTSATIPLPSAGKTTYVSVRATAGAWKGARSPEVAAC